MLKFISVTCLVVLSVTHTAGAQVAAQGSERPKVENSQPSSDPVFRDPTNAALVYYRAFLLVSEETINKVAEAIKPDFANWIPDTALNQVLIDNQGYASTLMRAAKIDACDFGLEYSQGIQALLPHLGKMRSGARFLAADARRLLANNQPNEASERIAAMFAMSRHLRGERLLISSLVSCAIHNLACAQLDYLIASGQLTASGKKQILAEMDRLNIPDPFGIKASVRGERYWVVVWIREKVSATEGAEAFRRQVLPLLSNESPDSPDVKAVSAMDVTAINADLDKAEPYYTAAIEAFDQPDAIQRLATLEVRIQNGDFGLLARHTAPALAKACEQYTKATTRQSEARARLDDSFARPD